MTIDLPVRTFGRIYNEDAIKKMIVIAQSEVITDEQLKELDEYEWAPTPLKGTMEIPDDVALKVARISEELCFLDAPAEIRKFLGA